MANYMHDRSSDRISFRIVVYLSLVLVPFTANLDICLYIIRCRRLWTSFSSSTISVKTVHLKIEHLSTENGLIHALHKKSRTKQIAENNLAKEKKSHKKK